MPDPFSKLVADFDNQNQIIGIDDRNNWNDLISNLCNVVMVGCQYAFAELWTNLGALCF